MFHKDGPTLVQLLQQSLASTQRGYDTLAPKFDVTPFRTPDELLNTAAQIAGAHDDVLDICCGTGAAMAALLPYTARRLVGIDFSPGMLSVAKSKLLPLNEGGHTQIEFIEGDVLCMEFSDEFDLAVCFGALGHILPSLEEDFLRRVYRSLKPGGVFLFVTATTPPIWHPGALLLRAFNGVMKVRNRLHQPEFIMYYLTFLLPDIERKLDEAGFQVTVYRELFPHPFQRACLVLASKI